jgi:hypothetical protein
MSYRLDSPDFGSANEVPGELSESIFASLSITRVATASTSGDPWNMVSERAARGCRPNRFRENIQKRVNTFVAGS